MELAKNIHVNLKIWQNMFSQNKIEGFDSFLGQNDSQEIALVLKINPKFEKRSQREKWLQLLRED